MTSSSLFRKMRLSLAIVFCALAFAGVAASGEVTVGTDNAATPPAGSLRAVVADVQPGETVTIAADVARVTLVKSNPVIVDKNGVTIQGNSATGFSLEDRLKAVVDLAAADPSNTANLKNQISRVNTDAGNGLTGLTDDSTSGSTGSSLVQAKVATTGLGFENLYVSGVYGSNLISSLETAQNGNDVSLGSMANVVFYDNVVKSGGLVRAYNANYNRSATIGNFKNALFHNNEATFSELNGGGLVGVFSYANNGVTTNSIGSFDNVVFSQNTVVATGEIYGGGLIGARSGGYTDDLSVGAIRGGVFIDNTVSAGGDIWGGGLIGVQTTMCPSQIGMGGLSDSVFIGNEVTSSGTVYGGLISGGVISSGGYVVSNTQFVDNKITSNGGYVYGGAIAINTNYTGGGTHKVTLTATNGEKTVFSGNEISDRNGSRTNSIYMGVIGRNSPGNGQIDITPDSGGSVELYDPIRVAMTHNSARTFTMNVGGSGRFVWGGENVIEARGGSTVNFQAGSNSTLEKDYQLIAQNYSLSLNLAGGANIIFDADRNPATALFTFDGQSGDQLNIAAGATLSTTKRVGTAVDYLVAVGSAGAIGSAAIANLNLAGGLSNAYLDNAGTELWVTLDASSSGSLNWTGAINGMWDGTTANWTGDYTTFADGDKATFGSGASSNYVAVRTDGVIVADMDVTESGYYFSGGKITGSTSHTTGLAATGKLTIADGVSVTFANAIDFENGIGVGTGGAVIFDTVSNATNTNDISGDGGLVKKGMWVLMLQGTNTYTGGTLIENGYLTAFGAGTVGTGTITVEAPGIFDMAFAGISTFANDITGSGAVQYSRYGELLLTGNNDYTGETKILYGGTLIIQTESAMSRTSGVDIFEDAIFKIDNALDMNFASPLSGDGRLLVDGAGALTLSGNSSHTGGSEIADGLVRLGHDAALGVLAATGDAGVVKFTGNATGIIVDNDRVVQNAFEFDAGLTGTAITANANLTVNTVAGRDAITLGAGADLTLAANAGGIFLNGGVAGAGSIITTGAGTVQVAASSNFGGATDVNSASFRVVSNAVYGNGASGGAFTTAAGTTLAGQGTINAETITIQGILSPDSVTATAGYDPAALTGSIGVLTLGGAGAATVLLDGVTLQVDLAGNNQSDRIVVSSGLAFGATSHVDIGVFQKGSFTILTGGLAAGDLANFDAAVTLNGGAITGRMQAALSVDSGSLILTTDIVTKEMVWTNGASTGAWDYTDANWTGHPTDTFAAGDYAVFTGTPNGTVTVGTAGVQTAGMSVTGDYTFEGGMITSLAGEVDGVMRDGKLVIDGNVVFNNLPNNFAGGIDLNGGSVAFNRSDQLRDGGKGTRVNGNVTFKAEGTQLSLGNAITIAAGQTATMEVGTGRELTLSGNLAGSGNLAKTSAGTLILTGENTGYSGVTTVQGGILRLKNKGGLGSGNLVLAAGTSLDIANAASIGNVISGQGGVSKSETGHAYLTGANTYSGGTTVNAGILTASAIGSLGDNANPAANLVAVAGGAELEVVLAAADVPGLPNFFARTSLAGDASLLFTTTEDLVLADDLSLRSAAMGSEVTLAADDQSVTLDSMTLDLGDASLSVTQRTNLRVAGTVDLLASETRLSGNLDLAAGSILDVAGSVIFQDNATLTVAATDDADIGRLIASGDIDFADLTTVYFGDQADYYKGQAFMEAGGDVLHFENLKSNFYTLELIDGTVVIKDLQSFVEIQNNLFGPDGQNRNVVVGGHYVDDNWDFLTPELQERLEDFVKHLDDAGLRTETAHTAFQQLYGEYGAYAGTFHRITTQRFTGALKNWVHQKMTTTRIDAYLEAASLSSGRALASPYYDDYPRRGDHPRYDGGYYDDGYRDYAPRREYPVSREYYVDEYETCAPSGRFWGGAFGGWAKQDPKERISGYKYNSAGFLLGYDYQVNRNFLVGVAAAYSTGHLKVTGLASRYDVDVFHAGLYANYRHDSNFYVTAQLAFGYGWNDSETYPVFGGKKDADFHTRSYSANLEVGYAFELPGDANLIPSAGLEYTYLSRDAWRENASGDAIANRFDQRHDNLLDIPLGVRLNKVFCFGPGRYLAPEIRASWIYTAGDKTPTAGVGLSGANATMSVEGVKPGDSRWQLGAGVKAQFSERVAANIDYNYELRDKFHEHNLSAELGLSF